MKHEFSGKISKNTQISNFMKIRLVGAKLFHANRWTDGQTNMTKLASPHKNHEFWPHVYFCVSCSCLNKLWWFPQIFTY